MRIAIMGSGGVGAYFGARLAAKGEDVVFIARGPHLAAMREKGLRLVSALGDVTLDRVEAVEDPGSAGPVDVILFCVKLYGVAAAAEAVKPMIGPDTMVVPVQNGVTAAEDLAAVLGTAPVVGGLVFISSFVTAPGVVTHMGGIERLVFGELDGTIGPRIRAFHSACAEAGIKVTASDDISTEIWKKFVLLGAFSAVSTLARQPIGPVLEDADLLAAFVTAMREVEAVARARNIGLDRDVVDTTLALTRTFPANAKASMLEDLEAGKPLELEWLSGAVARLGDTLGVATPLHHLVFAALKPFARGRHG